MNKLQELINEQLGNCPVCNKMNNKTFKITKWKKIELKYSICKNCSLVYLNPRMNDQNTQDFYEKYYRVLYDGDAIPTQEQINYQLGRALYFKKVLDPYIISINSSDLILDIGSSAGILLDTFSELKGKNNRIMGIEPGEGYRNHSKAKGYQVFENIDSVPNQYYNKFKLITMSHVLEHLANPVDFLSFVSEKLLSNDGIMMIEVPNLYGHASFEIAHNLCYTRKTLCDTLSLASLKVINLHSHANPLTSMRPMFLNAIVQKSYDQKIPTKYPSWIVKIKYQLGPNKNPKYYKYFNKLIQ